MIIKGLILVLGSVCGKNTTFKIFLWSWNQRNPDLNWFRNPDKLNIFFTLFSFLESTISGFKLIPESKLIEHFKTSSSFYLLKYQYKVVFLERHCCVFSSVWRRRIIGGSWTLQLSSATVSSTWISLPKVSWTFFVSVHFQKLVIKSI